MRRCELPVRAGGCSGSCCQDPATPISGRNRVPWFPWSTPPMTRSNARQCGPCQRQNQSAWKSICWFGVPGPAGLHGSIRVCDEGGGGGKGEARGESVLFCSECPDTRNRQHPVPVIDADEHIQIWQSHSLSVAFSAHCCRTGDT